MFVQIAIFISLLFGTCTLNHGFTLQDGDNIYENDNSDEDLSVDLEINDEDYEMNKENVVALNKSDNEDIFHILNNITDKEREEPIKLHYGDKNQFKDNMVTTAQAELDTSVTSMPTFHVIAKRTVGTEPVTNEHSTETILNSNLEPQEVYRAVKISNLESGYRILDSLKVIASLDMKFSNCTMRDTSGIGIRAIKCLLNAYKENRLSFGDLVFRLWGIAVVWLVVYLIVAIPLWCAKGWCRCCLCCKFFKPQETIQEAKSYLLRNPPGILVTKKGAIIRYEPTEREKDCYEEFEHFIRTL